jgi:hypothetical protein
MNPLPMVEALGSPAPQGASIRPAVSAQVNAPTMRKARSASIAVAAVKP